MCSVRDFMDFAIEAAGVTSHLEFTCSGQCSERVDFWKKLSHMWNPEEVPAESVLDIDAATMLTDDQWSDLEVELHQILATT